VIFESLFTGNQSRCTNEKSGTKLKEKMKELKGPLVSSSG
jgi:hypothetical protein